MLIKLVVPAVLSIASSVLAIADAGQADDLLRVLEELRSNIQEIRSIQFTATRHTTWRGDPLASGPANMTSPDAKLLTEVEYLYHSSGGKYRIDCDAIGETIAFNGSEFQRFNSHASIYTKSSTQPQVAVDPFPSPILWAYFWLLPYGERACLETLQSDDSWTQVGRSAALSTSNPIGATDGLVLVVERCSPSHCYIYRVLLEKNGAANWRPKSWYSTLKSTGETSMKVDVVETQEMEANDGTRIAVPVSVKVHHSKGPVVASEVRFRDDTVRINHLISEDVFDISSSAARFCEDADARYVKKVALPADAWGAAKMGSIAVTSLVLAVLVAALMMKRRSHSA